MKKKNEIIKDIELKNFILPKYNEIPDVGLYLDQVVKYINSYFVDYEDMLVTPSMLTNYVKQRIVSKVSKKTYSRDQIAHFFFIASTKGLLSLNNIALVFDKYNDEFDKFYDSFVTSLYNYIHDIKIENDQSMTNKIASTLANKMQLDIYFKNLK